MTPEMRERFAVLVERRLAGLLSESETNELSRLLETSVEARELYFRAVEFHLDLGSALAKPARIVNKRGAVADVQAPRRSMNRTDFVAIAAGFLVVATVIGFRLVGMGTSEDPSLSPASRGPGLPGVGGQGSRGMPKPAGAPPELPPRPPPPAYSGPQVDELKRGVTANVWLINMTGLISECMRYRNLTAEWGQLQADMGVTDGKIKHSLKELAKVGEAVTLENYLSPGDQIIGFAQRDFTTMKPGEAAAFLREWVSKWRAGPTLEQVTFIRDDKKMAITLEFPEETKELLSLVRSLDGTLTTAAAAMLSVPADLIKDINGRFDALPAGYRSFLMPKDLTRLEDMLKTKRGTSNDIEWLRSRVLGEAIPSFQRDADMIRSKILELEPKLKENVAADVIYRKNGTKFEGQIIQETDTFVKIKHQFGAVTIPLDDILRIEKGKGAALEFPVRLAETMKSATTAEQLEKLAPLLAWCIEKNLKTQKEYVGYVILSLDASHEGARKASGAPRPSISAPSPLPTTPK